MMQSLSDTVVCFDLDDTLYKEIDYLKSAYREIATNVGHPEAYQQMLDWYFAGENVFEKLIGTYHLSISIESCLKIYREHIPNISLDERVNECLNNLKERDAKVGLITDGRSITQRNKIKALGLDGFFDVEIISGELGSEKPNKRNYQVVMDMFPDRTRYIYVGDNPQKDFLAPNELGWETICLLDNGRNIHKQDFYIEDNYLPRLRVKTVIDLINYL